MPLSTNLTVVKPGHVLQSNEIYRTQSHIRCIFDQFTVVKCALPIFNLTGDTSKQLNVKWMENPVKNLKLQANSLLHIVSTIMRFNLFKFMKDAICQLGHVFCSRAFVNDCKILLGVKQTPVSIYIDLG